MVLGIVIVRRSGYAILWLVEDVRDGDGDCDDKEEPTETSFSKFFFLSYGAVARFLSMVLSPPSPPVNGDSRQLSCCKVTMSASCLIPNMEGRQAPRSNPFRRSR
jgi:hypothetical protein